MVFSFLFIRNGRDQVHRHCIKLASNYKNAKCKFSMQLHILYTSDWCGWMLSCILVVTATAMMFPVKYSPPSQACRALGWVAHTEQPSLLLALSLLHGPGRRRYRRQVSEWITCVFLLQSAPLSYFTSESKIITSWMSNASTCLWLILKPKDRTMPWKNAKIMR